MPLNRSGEPSNAQAALIASVDRMRRRKEDRQTAASTSAAGVIHHSKFREHTDVTPYRASKASSSRSKRAEQTTARQKGTKAAAIVKSRSATPSSAPSSAPSTPPQQAPPHIPAFTTDSCVPSSVTMSCLDFSSGTRTQRASYESLSVSLNRWIMYKEANDHPKEESLDSENDEIVREMFAKYTNFDMPASEALMKS